MQVFQEFYVPEGLAVSQLFNGDELLTILMHTSGQYISGSAKMPIAKQNDPQAFGSSSSYMRRYSLAAVTGIYQTDDDAEGGMGRNHVDNRPPVNNNSFSNSTSSGGLPTASIQSGNVGIAKGNAKETLQIKPRLASDSFATFTPPSKSPAVIQEQGEIIEADVPDFFPPDEERKQYRIKKFNAAQAKGKWNNSQCITFMNKYYKVDKISDMDNAQFEDYIMTMLGFEYIEAMKMCK
jgi:hypothetical protein